jgi:hypothetical protein
VYSSSLVCKFSMFDLMIVFWHQTYIE